MITFYIYTTLITLLLWYCLGLSGFAFWWLREAPFNRNMLRYFLKSGMWGIGSWLIGLFIYFNEK